MSRIAVIAGATGLIGGHCLRRLLSDSSYSQVTALVRRPSGLATGKAVERLVDFEALELGPIEGGADVFCTLGTTIGIAGSQKAFHAVDYEAVVNLARQSAQRGARQFLVVSSVGAESATSNFYLRTKREMEIAVSAMSFHGVHIFRPSFLIGKRKEFRPGERAGGVIAKALAFALAGSLRKYRAIEADTVAAAMIAAAVRDQAGVHVYDYDEMLRLTGAG